MKKALLISITFTIITLTLLIKCERIDGFTAEDSTPIHEIIDSIPAKIEYGLPIDSFYVESGIVKRNQNLAHILYPVGVSSKTIDAISKETSIFDVRQIRSGNKFKLLYEKDSLKTLRYFIYEHSLTDFVVIKLTDSIAIYYDEKPTSVEKKLVMGTIHTSLWDAMIENNINPLMSIELSEIYAWSIDFFGLQPNDQFYVIYEERFLDTISVGIERIHAALFNHQNKDFYAIYFVQDERGSFFDEDGESLKRAFLKAPLKYSRISSKFSNNRMHPVLKINRPHSGVDYAAPEGTPVYTVGDGIVITKGYQKNGAGNYVKIKHNGVYSTQYAHLKAFAKDLNTGDHVKQGDLIGYVGSTGYSTGPHLDFRFFKNGVAVDPLKVDAPPVEPIKKINREEFEKIRNEFIQQLNEKRTELTAAK